MEDQSLNQRIAPKEGGPQRISDEGQPHIVYKNMPTGRKRAEPSALKKAIKKTAFKKALPYLIAGGSTGLGIGLGLNQFIF